MKAPTKQNFKLQSGFNQQRSSQNKTSRDDKIFLRNQASTSQRDSDRDYIHQNVYLQNDPSNSTQISGNRVLAGGTNFQNYGLIDKQRDTQNSALTSLGGMNTITQPSVQNQRDYRSSSPLEGHYGQSRRYRDQDVQKQQILQRDYGMSSSDHGSNNYLKSLADQSYLNKQRINQEQERDNRGDVMQNMESNNLQQRMRQLETSPEQSIYSQNQIQSSLNNNMLSPKEMMSNRQDYNQHQYTSDPTLSNHHEDLNVDMQEVLMNLHSKMKSLENKYIDLANFYKMGAIKQKQQVQLQNLSDRKSPNRVFSNTADNFYQNKNQSPIRFQNQASIAQEEFDTVQEKNIISELLNEKTDLDRELENIVKLQSKIQEQDHRIHEKLDTIEQDYHSIKQGQPISIQQNQGLSERDVLELQTQVQTTLDKFEDEFILYINDNYSSFTESDIIGLFSNLKLEIVQIIQLTLQQNTLNPQSNSPRFDNQNSIQITLQSQKLLQQYKKDQNEFEINQEYTMQKIKKNVFDLQNKQDLALLDLKKSQMLIQNLTKSSHDLCISTIRQKEVNNSNKYSGASLSSPRSLAKQQDELAVDIQSQVKLLSSTFQQLNNKILQNSSELKTLGNIQDEFQSNLKTLKRNYTKLMDLFDNSNIQNIQERTQTRDSNSQMSQRMAHKELDDLKTLNQNLQQELKYATDRIQTMDLEIQSLLTENQKRGHRDLSSHTNQNFRNHNSRYENMQIQGQWQQSDGMHQQQRQYEKLRDQNQSLERQVKLLGRSLDEKNDQIDKLGKDLNNMSQYQNLRTLSQQNQERNQAQNVSIDQIHFYQQFADGQQQKLRSLIRQTQKFLYSMKKLQKAVHKKEPNVQREKNEFEDSRKELEQMLRQLKREIDENQNVEQPIKLDVRQGSLLQSANRIQQIAERNYSGERTDQRSNMMNQDNHLSGQQSLYKRQNIHQNQQSAYEQNSMLTNMNPVSDLSYQRDKSPIMLRQKIQKKNDQRELFKSIEPYERRANNMLLSSLSIERQQRSPSVGDPVPADRYNFTLSRFQSPSGNPSVQNQVQHDVEILLQQIKDLKHEREQTNLKLMKCDRDKDSYALQMQQLEHELERLRRQMDQLRDDIRDHQDDKHQLREELERALNHQNNQKNSGMNNDGNQQIQAEQKIRALEKELKDQLDKTERLLEQVQLNDRINTEFKRTIGFLEESVESAKRTINDQKEHAIEKEQQIEEQQTKLNQLQKQNQNTNDQKNSEKINEQQIRELRAQLLENVNNIEMKNKLRFEELESILSSKDQDIGKLKRLLDRKIKEREIQLVNMQQEQNSKPQLTEELESRIKDLEIQLDNNQTDIQQKIYENQQNERTIIDLKTKLNKIQDQLKLQQEKLIQLTTQNQEDIENLQEERSQELERLKQANLSESQRLNADHKNEINKINNQHKLEKKQLQDQHSFTLNELTEQHQTQLNEELFNQESELRRQMQTDMTNLQNSLKDKHDAEKTKVKESYELKLQSEIAKLTDSLKNDQQLETLQQMHSEERQSWTNEKLKLENALKDETSKSKKALLGKDQELKQLKIQLHSELEQLQVQQAKNEEILQKELDSKDCVIIQLNDKKQKSIQDYEQKLKEKNNENQRLQRDLNEITVQNTEHLHKIEEFKMTTEFLNSKIISVTKEKDKEVKTLSRDVKNLKDQHQNEIKSKSQIIEDLQSQILELEETIKLSQNSQTNQEEQLKTKIDVLKQQLKQKDQQMNDDQNTITMLNTKMMKLQQDICDKDEEINLKENLLGQTQSQLQKKIDKLEQELQQLKLTKNSIEISAQQEIQSLNQLIEEKDLEFQQVSNQLQESNDKLQVLNKEIQKIQAQSNKTQTGIQLKLEQVQQQLDEVLSENTQNIQLVDQKSKQISILQQNIADLENESTFGKNLRLSLQQQIDNNLKEYLEKENNALSSQQEIQSKIKTKDQEIDEMDNQIEEKNILLEELEAQVENFKSQIENISQANQQLEKQLENSQSLIKQRQQSHEIENASSGKLNQEHLNKKEQQIVDLMNEKEQIQEQLKEMVNQTTYEKQSLEGKLQTQLNQTLQQLQQKEKENHDLINQIQELENLLRDQEKNEIDYQTRISQLQDENYQLQTEYQEKDDSEREKYNQTLESNRNIIQMLKTELQKALDQHKSSEIHKNEGNSERENQLNNQIQTLQQQNQNLRTEFDDKMMDQKIQIDTLETDIQQKNELIEECNKVMEEFNDEKHEIKAKFKHLIQVMDSVEDESSYNEDDDIDLEECFERFEREFMRSKQRIESKIDSLERDNSIHRQEAQNSRDEVNQIQIKMAELQSELMNAINKLDSNDLEMRKKLDNAAKKVDSYKEKIIEKQKIIFDLETTMKQLIDMQQRNSENLEQSKGNQQKEKTDLMSKLQTAQHEILQFKQIQQTQSSKAQPADKVLIERIDQIEMQVMQLRKQIFMAKDQVIDQLSDTFAKKMKDVQNTYNQDQLLKAKLSEMKSNQQIETLNNNIKLIKYLTFGTKKLLVVQVISNNECYVIDDSKLGEVALTFLKQYLPSDDKELDSTFIHIDESQQKLLDQLQDKLGQLRDQRTQLQVELNSIKSKITLGSAVDKQRDLQTIQLEDEVGQLTKEVSELKIKHKDHQILENHLRARAIELNEIIKEITQNVNADFANHKMVKLIEDNESLRQQIVSQQQRLKKSTNKNDKQQLTFNEEDELVEEGDFFQGIEVADNINRSQQEHEDVNLFDQSSLYGVIEGMNEEERKFQSQQDVRIKQLEQQLEDIQTKNKTLQNEIEKSQQSSVNHADKGIFDNIRGTLIQFLKNCPLTEKNNELILEIIFDMMEFTDLQITEVQDKRKKGRSGSISASRTETEEELKKSTKKGIFNMFKKKDNSSTRKPEEQIVSPIRPIRRM